MVVTTRVRLDRIASATRNAGLSPEVIVGDQIVSAEGYVLAVRILEDKSTYNAVEDVTGRMLSLRAGDVLNLAVASENGATVHTLDRQLAEAGTTLGVATRLLR